MFLIFKKLIQIRQADAELPPETRAALIEVVVRADRIAGYRRH